MSDPRIEKYTEAVVALQEGRFDVSLPIDSDGDGVASLGAAVGVDLQRITADGLIKVADEALYQSKQAGRNRSSVRPLG